MLAGGDKEAGQAWEKERKRKRCGRWWLQAASAGEENKTERGGYGWSGEGEREQGEWGWRSLKRGADDKGGRKRGCGRRGAAVA